MGNIINPIALRLGWSKNWADNYYSRELYYPELTHKILRIKFLLRNLFKKYWRKSPYIFSHLILNKMTKGLRVHVFFYDSMSQIVWNRIFRKIKYKWSRLHIDFLTKYKRTQFQSLQRDFRRGRIKSKPKWPKRKWIPPKRLKVMFMLMYLYFTFLSKKARKFSRSSRKFLVNWLYYTIKRKWIKNLKIRQKDSNFIFHILLMHTYIKSREKMKKMRKAFVKSNYIRAIRDMVKNAFTLTWTKGYLQFFKLILKRFCYHLFKDTLIDFTFYTITNLTTNAMFIANYMARKLVQGYSLREIVRPIRKDLRYRMTNRYLKSIRRKNKMLTLKEDRKLLFNSFRATLIKIVRNFNLFNTLKTKKTLINYDLFLISFELYKNRIGSFNLIKSYFSNRPLMLIGFKSSNYSFMIFSGNMKNMKFDGGVWIKSIIEDLKVNYSSSYELQRGSIMTKNSFYRLSEIIKIGTVNYLRFINLKFSKFLLKWEYQTFFINKREFRQLRRNRYRRGRLLGYKLQFKGRFTRKQIAASHVYRQGTVSLNTIMANVDYGFATIPLINSSVGIKVWLGWTKDKKEATIKVV